VEWSQDGTKLLVSGPVAQEKLGVWTISIIGSSLKKLRDDADDAALSHDGSQIAFTDVDRTAIWVMAADGSQARPVIKAEPDVKFYSPTWFVNDKRLFYVKVQTTNAGTGFVFESRNLQGGDPVILRENDKITDSTWNQPGRFIYAQSEPAPNQYDSNLWELRYDVESGRPRGTPRKLTDWTGFSFESTGITSDGKHFVFLNDRLQSATYFGELAGGGDELKPPQRLTLNENLNWPGGWSSDSKTLFFYSNREGSFNIYQQGIMDRTAQPTESGAEDKWAPQASPDGKWIIYLQWAKAADGSLLSGKLMRSGVGGGAPESVMDINGHPNVNQNPVSTVGGFPSFRCPRSGTDCVIAEKQERQIVFSAFDPVKGRKGELARIPFNGVRTGWDLSPDGTKIAVSEFNYHKGEINIVPLNGGTPQEIPAMPWTELLTVAWAADGKSLFASSFSSRGTAIVHLDFAGHSKLLVKPIWRILTLEASPDGKYLAFGPEISNSNAWTMGSFPAK
jgi:Tol biopolymer transport system component